MPCDATQTFEYGDVLNPAGYESCQLSWLSADGSPAPVERNQGTADPGASWPRVAYPNASTDLLALHNDARYVAAGGARQIDSIPLETTRGVYVVRAGTGPCPGASPVDSRGCSTWQVLARVAPIQVPEAKPTATPAATGPATPIGEYPAGRALTTAELAALMAGPALPVNTAVVASVTIEAKTDVCPMNRFPTVGVVQGMGAQVCVMGAGVSAYMTTSSETGIFAFRYLAPGYLGLLGQITPASASRIAFAVTDAWPAGRQTFLVSGWLGAVETTASCLEPNPGDVLYPNAGDCPYFDWLGDQAKAPGVEADFTENLNSPNPSYDPGSLRGDARHVGAGGMRVFDAIDPKAPVFGVYVVQADTSACPNPTAADVSGCATWLVLARIADAPGPEPSPAMPTSIPTPTPTATPTATPFVLPAFPIGAAPIGLIAPDNLPLTEGVFATLWAADPAHLAGRVVIVKGPVPTGFICWDAGAADASAPPGTCHVATQNGVIGADGHYWVVQVGTGGKLSVLGELSTPQNSFVFTLEQLNGASALKKGDLALVGGWLVEHVLTCGDYGSTLPPGCGPFSEIASMATDNSPWSIGLQLGAYQHITGTAGDWTIEGPPVHGLFLVRVTNADIGTVLAQLEPVAP